jgi:hypothetical protein
MTKLWRCRGIGSHLTSLFGGDLVLLILCFIKWMGLEYIHTGELAVFVIFLGVCIGYDRVHGVRGLG